MTAPLKELGAQFESTSGNKVHLNQRTIGRHACDFPPLGLQLQVVRASNSRELDAAFATAARERADALFAGSDGMFVNRRVQLANLASRHTLPATFHSREIVEAGGLMSYGSDIADAFRQAGVYAGRIINGAKPADLPVVQSSKPTAHDLRRVHHGGRLHDRRHGGFAVARIRSRSDARPCGPRGSARRHDRIHQARTLAKPPRKRLVETALNCATSRLISSRARPASPDLSLHV